MIARLAHVARAALTPQAPSSAGAQGSAHPTVKGQEWAADAASDGRPIRVRVFMPTSAVRTSARRGRRSSQKWRWRTRRTPDESEHAVRMCSRAVTHERWLGRAVSGAISTPSSFAMSVEHRSAPPARHSRRMRERFSVASEMCLVFYFLHFNFIALTGDTSTQHRNNKRNRDGS